MKGSNAFLIEKVSSASDVCVCVVLCCIVLCCVCVCAGPCIVCICIPVTVFVSLCQIEYVKLCLSVCFFSIVYIYFRLRVAVSPSEQ